MSTDRLAKLCGMLGSPHDGERAAAAAMADKMVRGLGMTWTEIISAAAAPRATAATAEKIAFALANIDALSAWERNFLHEVNRKNRELSPKQLAVLDQIVTKARAYAEATS